MIHTQNITFNKSPGQNIRVRLTHFLPSGKYQLAMVPYKKNENNILEPLARPSCSCRLERLDLGKHALSVILSEFEDCSMNKSHMRNTFSFACCCDCDWVDDDDVLQLQGGGHHDW